MSALSGPAVRDTFSDASGLFVNKFVRKDSSTPDENQAVDYRHWKEEEQARTDHVGATRARDIRLEAKRDSDRRSLLKVKEAAWQCCIDSGNRDLNVYPQPSSFSINMGQQFQNVIRTRLISLEFPNVLNVVNKYNNTLKWINLEDVDLDYPVYSITIPPGNYDYKTLQSQLNSQLHSSDLKRRNGAGNPHFFVVTLDGSTDKVSFSSIIPQSTGENPIMTIKDSNRVRVSAPNHGFVTGDTVRVIGALGTIGGITSAELNGSFSITVPLVNGVASTDLFEYEVANVARGASANLSGGGKTVQIGKEAPFQFKFQSDPTNAAPLLGFPLEDSSVSIPDSFIQTYSAQVLEVRIGLKTVIVAQDHGLVAGDRIYLNNFVVSPSIYNASGHRGEFYVDSVTSPDVFQIDFATTHISDVSSASVGTRIVTMYLPGHGFNRIVEFSSARVETLFPHGLTVGQTIFVRCTLYTENDFAGAFVVTTLLDDDQFQVQPVLTTGVLATGTVAITAQTVDALTGNVTLFTSDAHGYSTGDTATVRATGLTQPLLEPMLTIVRVLDDTSFVVAQPSVAIGAYALPVDATDGILMSHQDFTLYNCSPVGGFGPRDLNNTLFSVRKVLSPDYFTFTTRTGFSSYLDRGGGDMRINSLVKGWRGTQTNDQATGTVYRPIALTGDTYCFLRVPSLGKHSTIINTGPVNNIIAKVQLTAPPVTNLFNTAVSGSLEFRDGPLPTLKTIDFQWVDKNGDELDFGHFQWSCVLEVVTLMAVNEYNFQPVKTYIPDPVDCIQWARGAEQDV